MLVALMAHDNPDSLAIRQANRPDHVAYLKASDIVSQAGPLLDAKGEMIGSLIILEVDAMEDAVKWSLNDPYAKADLFREVTLTPWNKVIG